MTASREDLYRIRLLKIPTPDFRARNLGRDRQHGDAAALAIVKAVDQVHVPRPTASGAYRQLAGKVLLCAGRERACLFIAHTNPFDVLADADRIRDAIERIARNSVNALNLRFHQNVYQQVSHSFCHGHSLPDFVEFFTFSNPSVFSDRRRRMPWRLAHPFRNGWARGPRDLRLGRPEAITNLPRSMPPRSSHRAGRFQPTRERRDDPAYPLPDAACEED